ncbi:MAG: long-chain fatty acid--CoA ligase [Burkholderiaceae bacterium]
MAAIGPGDQNSAQHSSAAESAAAEKGNTTFPRLLEHHARVRPNKAAVREKDLGIWQTWTWSRLNDESRQLAAGLAELGVAPGDNVALIGENRPRLYASMMAIQMLGAIAVPLYQDAVAKEMVFVFENANIQVAIVEDQEQVDKMLEVNADWGQLKHVIYDDPRGLRDYGEQTIMSHEQLLERGKAAQQAKPGLVQERIDAASPDDTAGMFYTSGTTGNPKGVIHTHRTLISMSSVASEMEGLTDNEEILAYLPVAWIGQNIFSYAQWMINGFTVNCPESVETVQSNLREIGPSYYFAPPRVLEGLLTQVTIRMEDAAPLKRKLFDYFMDVARRVGGRLLDGDTGVTGKDKLLYKLGNWLVYSPLKDSLGMSNVRLAYTAGEAIGPDLFVFFRSLGINLKQLYGQTETAVWVCVQPNGQVRADTVGPALSGVEIRTSEAGEVLVRSPSLLREYYRNAEATAEVKDSEGWYHTGDAGYLDSDGHLKIIDRAKDVGKLANGAMFAPKYIENKLKFFPYIKEAVAIGDGKDKAMAMINIDFPACSNFAERSNLSFGGYVDLAGRDEIYALIEDCVNQVNKDLADDPMMSTSQIHRFLILHKELEADDGELTRTSKVRRGFIRERYASLVDAFYDGKTEQHISTEVTFEDGRKGAVEGNVKIRDTKIYDAKQEAAA